MTSVAILGQNLAGLSVAWHLGKNGYRDFALWGDPPGSRDSLPSSRLPALNDSYAKELILELLGDGALVSAPDEWCYWKGRFVRVPLEAHLSDLPMEVTQECLLGFIRAEQARGSRPPGGGGRGSTLEDLLRESYGSAIADRFWIPYYAKRSTVHPRELTAAAVSGGLTPARLEQVLAGAISPVPSDPSSLGTAAYSIRGGPDSLEAALAARVPSRPWVGECEIDLERRVVRFGDGSEIQYRWLVSSVPLPRLGKMVRALPEEVHRAFAALRYASCSHTHLAVERTLADRRAVLFPEPEYRFHRVTLEGGSREPGKTALVTIEVAHPPHEPLDRMPPNGQEEAVLRQIGLLGPQDRVVDRTVRVAEIGYVVQDQNHRQAVGRIRDFLEDHGIVTIGPAGAWDNSGPDQAILAGKRIAEAVLQSGEHDIPLRAPERTPQVSIVIPVYREEQVLENFTVQILEAIDRLGVAYELILAENGGRDRTGEIADDLAKRFRQVRVVHYPDPNYGRALALGILHATGDNVVCFEIDFWDAEFVEIVQVLLKKYDAVIGSKRAPGARDRRPFLRRAITAGFNIFLKLVYGFQGTDTHGIKAFRREKAVPVVRACETGKDIFATELVLRMERAGFYICEMPLEIEELRAPSINLLRRVPSTIRNLVALWKATRQLPKADFRKMEPAPKVSVAS